MENLRRYVSTVTAQVQGLVENRKVPNQDQLNSFISQVVGKLAGGAA